MSFDVGAIKAANKLSDVVGRYVKLTRNGTEFEGLCPFHGEKSPSFTVSDDKGFYHCFGCGGHGDQISFLTDLLGVPFAEACEILGGERSAPDTPRYAAPPADTKTVYDDLMPATPSGVPASEQPIRLWNPKRGHWGTFVPSMVFPYHAVNGDLLGCVLRIDMNDGGKETPTIRYAASVGPQGEPGWSRWPFDKPRPLFGLETLPADPTEQVVVAEGEKTAMAAARLLERPAVTFNGGPNGIKHTDWSPMARRRVLLIPDADRKVAKTPQQAEKSGVTAGQLLPYDQQIGPAAMLEVAARLHALGCEVRIVDVGIDEERSDGWDLADAEAEGWDFDRTIEWLKPRVSTWTPGRTVVEEPPLIGYDGPGNSETGEISAAPRAADGDDDYGIRYFRVLGHNKGHFYYFPRGPQQVVTIAAGGHTLQTLMQLAPIEYWEMNYPKKGGKVDIDAAINALFTTAYGVGPYNPAFIRGRGAWMDDGRAIVHTGRTVIVDGNERRPETVKSEFVYEAAPSLNLKMAEPASNKEANKLVDICRRLTWERNLSGDLLAGWCIVAPVCGALDWRSHIWVTGLAQSGKSTVIKHIIKQVVGNFGLYMDGKTTEAGVRQMVGIDARPVIMDEVEGEDANALARVQGILDLARASSSGAYVTKGTTSGRPITYSARSSFCFASINVSISQYADESRVSRLVLRRNTAEDALEHYRALSSDIADWFTPDYSAKMFSRSVRYLDVLQKNVRHFRLAASRLLKSARDADQVGTLLAGLYLCFSTKEIDAETAEMWMSQREWGDHTAIHAETDDKRLLERLMTRQIRKVNGQTIELNLGDAIVSAHDGIPDNEWEKRLRQVGIRIERDHFVIANKSSPIDKMLEGTPWAKDWASKLKTLADERLTDTIYFCPGIKTRGVKLPLSLLKESV